ncbi:hypothetical protein O8C79_03375 [Aliarcobacter butzleri]|uniref:hypothetical protein n=1 Tax=Aliarcobacter butzleri TaxID=28197 RepID=UPI00263E5F23|nr:hypothetical protein [Aliarcobacter butzleri]MDN5048255.1 hypothetical protein [Aliarcobacter butzleri]MDN5059041.1 hypothetical protein [Aliarcobacter butzleri]MDN5104337.1 hypothetical protein [Aliarcobacter butzleri]MDN5109484.1 hypothetical protein [Aliarcobacter butzleri]
MQITSTTSILGTTSQNNSINIDENSSSSNEFSVLLENKTNEQKKTEEESLRKQLLDELNFVAKTGFTKDELERIKKILEELAKQRAESRQTAQTPEEYIKNLKADLQYAVEKVTGKKMDFNEDMLNNFVNSQNSSNQVLATTSTDEELRLIGDLKQKK